MEKYINYCTEKQIDIAFRLGAPIVDGWVRADGKGHDYDKFSNCFKHHCIGESKKGNFHLRETPTTQQIIGWLEEEKNIVIDIDFFRDRGYQPYIDYKDLSPKEFEFDYYSKESTPYYNTRKEAELAAIDSALNYLEKGWL